MKLAIQFDRNAAELVARYRRIANSFNASNQRLLTARRDCGLVALNDARVIYLGASAGDGTWRPLAPSTLKRKTKPPRKGILRVTDRLYESLRPGQSNNVLHVDGEGVRYGTRKWYGKYHQYGTSRIPVRKVLQPPRKTVVDRCRAVLTSAVRDVLT